MSFEWGGDASNDDESFADRPVELDDQGKWQDVQTVAPPPQPRTVAPARAQAPPAPVPQVSTHASTQEVVEVEEETEEGEEDFSSVLSDAKLRLAMGTLWEMLMNNSIFQDLDVDPKAVKSVERKVKNFAREQMEIMLGMRQEKMAQQYAEFNAAMANPFNDLEVQVLKAVAATATQGATQKPEAQTFTAAAVPVRKSSLTPIGQPARKTTAPAAKKLPQAPATPIKRKKLDNAELEQALIQEGVEREFIEEAKHQLATDTYRPIDKPISQLTEQELQQRAKAGQERITKSVKSPSALPMPDQDTINAHVTNRVQAAATNPTMQGLMSLLLKPK